MCVCVCLCVCVRACVCVHAFLALSPCARVHTVPNPTNQPALTLARYPVPLTVLCGGMHARTCVRVQAGQAGLMQQCSDGDASCQPQPNTYRLVQTELVALLAGARLEDCVLPLSRAGVTSKDQLKTKCCQKRAWCRESMKLPINSKAEKQRWGAVLDAICDEVS